MASSQELRSAFSGDSWLVTRKLARKPCPSVKEDISELRRFAKSFFRLGLPSQCEMSTEKSANFVLELVRVTNTEDTIHSARSDSSAGSTVQSARSNSSSASVSSSASIKPNKSFVALDTGKCEVNVEPETLELLGLSTDSYAGFRVTWFERRVPSKRSRDFGHKLQVVGDCAVSVDGIIVPKLGIAEVYEGSQISLMCKEPGSDRLAVMMILRAHFDQVKDTETSRISDVACWGACLFRE